MMQSASSVSTFAAAVVVAWLCIAHVVESAPLAFEQPINLQSSTANLRLPTLPSSLDISFLPPIAGETTGSFSYSDIPWQTLFLSGLNAQVSAKGDNVTFALAGADVLTAGTRFTLSQVVVSVTVSCGGQVTARARNVALHVTFSRSRLMAGEPVFGSALVDGGLTIGSIDIVTAFDSGVCSIASSLLPSFNSNVNRAITKALTLSGFANFAGEKLTDALRNLTSSLGNVGSLWDAAAMLVDDAARLLESGGDDFGQPLADLQDLLKNGSSSLNDAPSSVKDLLNAPASVQNVLELVLAVVSGGGSGSGNGGSDLLSQLPSLPMAIEALVAFLAALGLGDVLPPMSSSSSSFLNELPPVDNLLDMLPPDLPDMILSTVAALVSGDTASIPPLGDLGNSIRGAVFDPVVLDALASLAPPQLLEIAETIRIVVDMLMNITSPDGGSSMSIPSSASGLADFVNFTNLSHFLLEFVNKSLTEVPELHDALNLSMCVQSRLDRYPPLDISSIQTSDDFFQGKPTFQLAFNHSLPTRYVVDFETMKLSATANNRNSPNNALASWTLQGPTIRGVLLGSMEPATYTSAYLALAFESTSIVVSQWNTTLNNRLSLTGNVTVEPSVGNEDFRTVLQRFIEHSLRPAISSCMGRQPERSPAGGGSGGSSPPPSSPPPMSPPPPACRYRCPDLACSESLVACRCSGSLEIVNVSAAFGGVNAATHEADPRNAISAAASAVYAQHDANCTSFSYTSLLSYRWDLVLSATNTTITSVASSYLSIPALKLTAGASYTLRLTVTGILREIVVYQWPLIIVAPPPVVSITTVVGAKLRLSNKNAVVIPARIVDVVRNVSQQDFYWNCTVVEGAGCPSLSNASVAMLTIPANSSAGTYLITFTYYMPQYSSTLNLTLVAAAVPVVRILLTTTPVASVTPPLFLPSQMIQLAVSVTSFPGATNVSWYINDVRASGNTLYRSILASTLTATSLGTLGTDSVVTNAIRVRVSDASDASVYGEATLAVAVLPTSVASLTVSNAANSGSPNATALTDSLLLSPSSSLSGMFSVSWLSLEFAFGYEDGSTTRPLFALPGGGGASTFTATAPLTSALASASSASVTFFVKVRINGFDAANSTTTFTVVKASSSSAAATHQLLQIQNVTDPSTALQAADNIRSLLQDSSFNATVAAQLAIAAATAIANTVTDAASLSSDQQGTLFTTLTVAVSHGSAADKSSLRNTTATLLTQVISAGTLSASNGAAALQAISTLNPNQTASLATSVANILANSDSLAIGSVSVVEVSGIVVAALRQPASALGGVTMSAGGSSGVTLTIPADLNLGIDENSIVSVASTTFDSNPFANDAGGNAPRGAVVSFTFSLSSSTTQSIANLSTPLNISMGSSSGGAASIVCKFWDTVTLAWSTSGVAAVVEVDSTVVCLTTHLTSFATFNGESVSSSSALIGAIVGGSLGGIVALFIVVWCVLRSKNKGTSDAEMKYPHTPEAGAADRAPVPPTNPVYNEVPAVHPHSRTSDRPSNWRGGLQR